MVFKSLNDLPVQQEEVVQMSKVSGCAWADSKHMRWVFKLENKNIIANCYAVFKSLNYLPVLAGRSCPNVQGLFLKQLIFMQAGLWFH